MDGSPFSLIDMVETPSQVDVKSDSQFDGGDASMCTADEMLSDHCCSCKKRVDPENSLVIVRASVKTPEARRCRSCHNVRGAIQRLANRHGNLVKEFTSVSGDRLQEFYSNFSNLRGEDLRMKIEETVTDWKTATTTYKFTQDAEFMDEIEVRKKYVDRPNVAENILLNGRRFFCPVKKVMLFADPKYNAKVEDTEELGTSTKRKAQTALKEDEEPKKPPRKPRKGQEDKNIEGEEPKLKAGEKKYCRRSWRWQMPRILC